MFPSKERDQVNNVPTKFIGVAHSIPSAQKVFAINDLLKEILLRLPPKSLFRFKSVSKHWNFIISNQDFLALRNRHPFTFSGLFLQLSSNNCTQWSKYAVESNSPLEFLPLEHDDSHLESMTHIPNLSCIIILNSCHGLLLCLGYNELERKGGYQVLNPTTKQFSTIEMPRSEINPLAGISLAYDPLVSAHYKIVVIRVSCFYLTNYYGDDLEAHIIIQIYSSETKSWKVCREKYTIEGSHYIYYGGLYWNGAINWLNPWSSPMYFKVEEELMGTMPALISPEGKTTFDAHNLYFGTCHGHLYCSEIYSPTVIFNVYEMKKDYSEWVVKYNVDLTILAAYFPIMFEVRGIRQFCSYDVLCVVPGGDDEDEGFMVLHIPGKFIRYNLADNSYKITHEYEYEAATLIKHRKYELQTNPYVESFASV